MKTDNQNRNRNRIFVFFFVLFQVMVFTGQAGRRGGITIYKRKFG